MADKKFQVESNIDVEKQVLALLDRPEFEKKVLAILEKHEKKKKKPSGSGGQPPAGGQFWSNVGLPRDAME